MLRPELKVLYNEHCPICRAEIAHYRSYSEKHALAISFEDLNATDLHKWGVSAEDAARRLHVRDGQGVRSGLSAFLLLWDAMPRYRWIARIAGFPLVRPAADWVYNKILAPWLYRRHVARSAAR